MSCARGKSDACSGHRIPPGGSSGSTVPVWSGMASVLPAPARDCRSTVTYRNLPSGARCTPQRLGHIWRGTPPATGAAIVAEAVSTLGFWASTTTHSPFGETVWRLTIGSNGSFIAAAASLCPRQIVEPSFGDPQQDFAVRSKVRRPFTTGRDLLRV